MPQIWVMDGEHEAAFINLDTGQLLGYVWHDYYGKYYPTVYVSLFTALKLVINGQGYLVSLRPFPRFAFDLIRSRNLKDACEEVTDIFQPE